jgi:phosphomevalonate kinase
LDNILIQITNFRETIGLKNLSSHIHLWSTNLRSGLELGMGNRGSQTKTTTAVREVWLWAKRALPKLYTRSSHHGLFINRKKRIQGQKLFGRDILEMWFVK